MQLCNHTSPAELVWYGLEPSSITPSSGLGFTVSRWKAALEKSQRGEDEHGRVR